MGPATAARVIPVLVGLFAFFTPFSIAGAHTSLAVAVVVLLITPEARLRAWTLLRRHPLTIPLLLWSLVAILAVVFALHPMQSLPKLKKLALLTLLPLGALPGVRAALRPILTVLIASTALVAIYGLVVFLAQGGGIDARIRGISGFYMTVAGILMIVGLLCLAELLAALKDPHPRRIFFLVASGVVILGALVGTYTRGSWIGFAAGALYVLRKRRTALLSLGVVVGLFLVLGPAESRGRFLALFQPDHPRNVERVFIWKHGLAMVNDRPWTGVGLVIPEELMDQERETPGGVIRLHSHLHNTYLQIAVSMGIPALLVFGWWVVALFRTGRRAERAEIRNLWEEGLVSAYPGILIALLANGLFEWNFGDSEILGLFYCLSGFVLGVESGAET